MNLKDYTNYLNFLKTAIINFSICFILLSCSVFSQEKDSVNVLTTDQVGNEPQDTVFVMEKSPWGAVLRSALIPGLGQVYNQSYWKVPIIWGFLIYNISVYADSDSKYDKYKNLYLSEPTNDNAKRFREFYHDQRDQFAFWIGLTYFLNLIDAYVDAHMFDFNVTPDYKTNGTKLNLRINF